MKSEEVISKNPECFRIQDFWSGRQDSNLRHPRLHRRFAVPCVRLGTNACVAHRPLHQNACPSSATGSGQAFCPKQAPCFARRMPLYENTKRTAPRDSSLCVVQVARLELAASCSQSRRVTNCATPGYFAHYSGRKEKMQSQNEWTRNII